MAMPVFRWVVIHLHACFISQIVFYEKKNTELCTYVKQKLVMFILLFWKWLINLCEVLTMTCVLKLYLIWHVRYTDKYCSWVSLYQIHMQSSKTRFMYIKVLRSYLKITCSLITVHYSKALTLLIFIAYTYIPQMFQNFCFCCLGKPKLCKRFLQENSLRVGLELWKQSLASIYYDRCQDDGVAGATEGDFPLPGDTCWYASCS